MAKRERYGVGSIVGLRRCGKAADPPHHIHHLLFLRPSITDNRLFDLQRRVLIDPDACLLTGQKDHTASVRNGDSRRDIGVEKQFLDRDGVRMKQVKKLTQVRINLLQTLRETDMRRRCNNPALDKADFIVFFIYHAEPDRRNARVYSHNSHTITSAPYINTFLI